MLPNGCMIYAFNHNSPYCNFEKKVKADVLYSATSIESLASEHSHMDHTVLPTNVTISVFAAFVV